MRAAMRAPSARAPGPAGCAGSGWQERHPWPAYRALQEHRARHGRQGRHGSHERQDGGRPLTAGADEGRERTVRRGIDEIYPRLWRYCLTLAGRPDRADDLAQAASLRALEKAELLEPGTRFDAWMFRLTQRVWLNEMRADAVRAGGGLVAVEEAGLVDRRPGPEADAGASEVMRGVMALPEAQRLTVLLVYVEGHSYREAAGVLDIPVGTVMSRLAAARAKLNASFGAGAATA